MSPHVKFHFETLSKYKLHSQLATISNGLMNIYFTFTKESYKFILMSNAIFLRKFAEFIDTTDEKELF